MRNRRKSRSLLKSVVLTAAFLTTANLAVAQQRTPYYRFGATSSTTVPTGPSLPSPWTPPTNDSKLEFGKPSVASYSLKALVGEPVSLTLVTSGGTAPFTWQPTEALPSNLSYANGIISGTPNAAAKTSWNVSVKDAQGKTAQGRVSIDIVEPVISISGIKPFARVGAPFQGLIASNVASATYTMRGLPGATLGSTGLDARAAIGGEASAPGSFQLSVDVTRPGTSISASATREVTIASPLEIAFDPPSVPALRDPVSVNVLPLNVGGTPTLKLVSPTLAALNARGLNYVDGRLTGTLGYGAALNVALSLEDSADKARASATLRIPEIINGASSLVIAGEMRQGTSAKASIGSTTAATVRTEIPSPRCTATQSVPGLSISTVCEIYGNANTPGDYTLALTILPASNPGATPVTVSAPVKVHPALTLTTAQPSFDLAPGQPLDLSVTAAGVIGQASYDLTGTTPAQLSSFGLSFSSATGAVTGLPSPDINISFGIRVRDSHDGAVATRGFTVKSSGATLVSNVPTLNLRSGDIRTFFPTTNIESPTFSLEGAPSYVSVNASTGLITVAAPAVTAAEPIPGFVLKAVSSTREGVAKQVQIGSQTLGTIRPELKIAIAGTTNGRGNVSLQVPYAAEGVTGAGVVSFLNGSLPTGMSFQTGAITGTPTVPGTYTATLRLTDNSDGRYVDHPFVVVIGPSLDIAFSGPVSPAGKGAVDQPFSVTATAQNSVGTVTFANVATAARPALLTQAGLSMTPQGVISGTPTTPLTAAINIRMTEVANGVTTVIDRDLALAISAPQTAAGLYPVATLAGVERTAELYDASTTTSVSLPSGSRILLKFADEVTVNGVIIQASNGPTFYVRNVKTGQVYSTTNSNGASSITQSTSDSWEIYTSSSGAIAFTTARLTFGGNAPIAPSFTDPALSGGSYALKGAGIGNLIPSAVQNATAPQSWTHSGNLPPGTSINSTTGAITGNPSEIGTFDFSIVLTDARGIRSAPSGTLRLRVMTNDLAMSEFPTITGGYVDAEDTLAALYDGYTDTVVNFAAGQTLTYTYSKTVFGSQLYIPGASGSWLITSVDEGKTFTEDNYYGYNNLRPTIGSYPGESKTWTVRKGEAAPMSGAVLRGGGSGADPVAPYLQYASTTATPTKGVPFSMLPSTKSPGSLKGVALTGSYQVISGELPNNMFVNPSTGEIYGTATEIGEKTAKIAFVSTIPGVRSFARTMTITVLPIENAGTLFPAISASLTDPDRGNQPIASADLLGYLYDGSTTSSKFNLAVGQQVTLTYPTEVTVSRILSSTTGGFSIVNNDTGKSVWSGSISGGGSTNVPTTYGKSFTITATTASVQAYLKLGYNGTSPNAPYFGSPGFPWPIIANEVQSKDLVPAGAIGGMTYTWTGLPSGLSVDATGKIVGSATEVGTFVATIRGRDSRNISTAPITASITVFIGQTAQNTIATASAAGGLDSADVSAALMDTSTLTTVTLAKDETITFSYPSATLTSGFNFQVSGTLQPLEVRDGAGVVRWSGTPTAGSYQWNATGGLVGPNGTYASQSATYTVKNIGSGPVVLQRAAPHYASSLPPAITYPMVNAYASYTGIARTGAYTVNPLTASGTQNGVVGWTRSGDLPTGFEFNTTTGVMNRLAGAPQATGPETKDVIVSFVDGRGLASMKWKITLQVN